MSDTILSTIRDNKWLKQGFETMAFLLSMNTVTANLAGIDATQELQRKINKEAPLPQDKKSEDGKVPVKKYTVDQSQKKFAVDDTEVEGGKNGDEAQEQSVYGASPEEFAKLSAMLRESAQRNGGYAAIVSSGKTKTAKETVSLG